MAALYSAAIAVREIAKLASQKARPPTRVSTNTFFQIPFVFFIFFSYPFSCKKPSLTVLKSSEYWRAKAVGKAGSLEVNWGYELAAGFVIREEDWEHTPLSVQAVLLALWQENQTFKQQVAEWQGQMAGLRAELEKLSERVNKNSRNSSKPPSSDPPQSRGYPKRAPTGQKKGGKKGHHGRGRKLKPPEEVSRVVVSKPTACAGCGALLLGADPHPERHQVSELPPD